MNKIRMLLAILAVTASLSDCGQLICEANEIPQSVLYPTAYKTSFNIEIISEPEFNNQNQLMLFGENYTNLLITDNQVKYTAADGSNIWIPVEWDTEPLNSVETTGIYTITGSLVSADNFTFSNPDYAIPKINVFIEDSDFMNFDYTEDTDNFFCCRWADTSADISNAVIWYMEEGGEWTNPTDDTIVLYPDRLEIKKSALSYDTKYFFVIENDGLFSSVSSLKLLNPEMYPENKFFYEAECKIQNISLPEPVTIVTTTPAPVIITTPAPTTERPPSNDIVETNEHAQTDAPVEETSAEEETITETSSIAEEDSQNKIVLSGATVNEMLSENQAFLTFNKNNIELNIPCEYLRNLALADDDWISIVLSKPNMRSIKFKFEVNDVEVILPESSPAQIRFPFELDDPSVTPVVETFNTSSRNVTNLYYDSTEHMLSFEVYESNVYSITGGTHPNYNQNLTETDDETSFCETENYDNIINQTMSDSDDTSAQNSPNTIMLIFAGAALFIFVGIVITNIVNRNRSVENDDDDNTEE